MIKDKEKGGIEIGKEGKGRIRGRREGKKGKLEGRTKRRIEENQ